MINVGRETLTLRGCATYVDHVWVEVEAGDSPLRPKAWGDVPGNDTCTTRHIENTLAGVRIRVLDQVRCPGSEQTWHHVFLIKLCWITHAVRPILDLPPNSFFTAGGACIRLGSRIPLRGGKSPKTAQNPQQPALSLSKGQVHALLSNLLTYKRLAF